MSNNRDYKKFIKGNFYHIYNRGNDKIDIFRDKADYLLFIKRLQEGIYPHLQPCKRVKKGQYIPKLLPTNAFDLVCYCLMPNHFHLLLYQKTDLPISALMSKICTSYSKCFNKKYQRTGQLFQDQFKAVCVESDEQLLWLSGYIHNNPLKAGLVKDIRKYGYSSYQEYMKINNDSLCTKDSIMKHYADNPAAYMRSISDENDDVLTTHLTIE